MAKEKREFADAGKPCRDARDLYRGLGYVKFIDAHGSDERIIEAARMSTSGAFRGWGGALCPACHGTGYADSFGANPDACSRCKGEASTEGDEKLLRYLWRNGHHSPFEMAHLVFEWQVPIFVARQIMRHRLFSFNELSARYTEMPDEAWLPGVDDVRGQNLVGNRQGSLPVLPPGVAQAFTARVAEHYRVSFALYQDFLDAGIAREQARTVVPVGTMTRVRMGGNLRMWIDLLGKRLPADAQPETREVMHYIAKVIEARHPRTFGLFVETMDAKKHAKAVTK